MRFYIPYGSSPPQIALVCPMFSISFSVKVIGRKNGFLHGLTNGPRVLDSVVEECKIYVHFPLRSEMEAISGRPMGEIEEIEELSRASDTRHKM